MRLGILFVAAASDVLDGMWARRIGGSRAGAVLDPIADKAFVGTAFVVVAVSGDLTILEALAVLLRDMLAVLSFIITWILGRPTTIPARAGGKVVTVLQLLTLLAWVLGSDLIRPLAWATAAISVYAVADYGHGAWSKR
jgi:CDP-diacylglycerol--glycerol-3-phosphate 3-phosphatidyltransferase/cardiolipin synthase